MEHLLFYLAIVDNFSAPFDFQFDMIFADPPYFLSNGGILYNLVKLFV